MTHQHDITASHLTVGYVPGQPVIPDFTATLPGGKVTTVIGPNGCGKSTLLRALGRLLPSEGGEVHLGDTDISGMRRKELAKIIGMLPQSPVSPPGLIVSDLVARGRHPHQSWIRQWSSTDEEEVMAALAMTDVAQFADRSVDSLSGGQRQRVWISMVLAQHTDVLFLDEPTTYLDLSHSIEVLELVNRLREELDRTVVMVLHDLNLAVQYSDNLLVMRSGELMAAGTPSEVITPELLRDVFDLDAIVIENPVDGGPLIVPRKQYGTGRASETTGTTGTAGTTGTTTDPEGSE